MYHQGLAYEASVSKVITYCQSGWPHKHQILDDLIPIQGKLMYVAYNIMTISYFMVAACIMVPPKLCNDSLAKITKIH